MKGKSINEKDLVKVFYAASRYDRVLFECFRENSEYVKKMIAINANLNVLSKEYSSVASKEELENWFKNNNYFVIGCYSLWYNSEEERVEWSYDTNNDLIDVAKEINNIRENQEKKSEIYVPNHFELISSADKELVNKAFEFAKRAHDGQSRLDGTEFITHPVRVAENVRKYYDGPKTPILTAVSNLHDTVEDTKTTISDITENFGEEIAGLVLELTNDDMMKHKLGKAVYLTNKMLHMSDYALLIKLCDRLDNITDLNNTSKEFRMRYSSETLEILENLVLLRKLDKIHLKIISDILDCLSKLKDLEDNKKESIKTLSFKIVQKYAS